jgi:hypothetical protein
MYRVCYNICFENPACPRALVPLLALVCLTITFNFGPFNLVHYYTYVVHVKYSESNATMGDGFYISLASRLACATCERRCARSEFCVP